MNKAITHGLHLDPPRFAEGLQHFSRTDGTPGSDSYASLSTAGFVPADGDFAGCLEVLKTQGTQRLRAFARTPVEAGCYLRVRARVKAISGALPSVRIAATPRSGDDTVGGLVQHGPSVALTEYGRVVEVDGVVATGARAGVHLPWDDRVRHAHVGLDLVGPSGGVVRIDDLRVEDVTGAFLRGMMDWVDVRDHGARGDGSADDTDAFEAAERAAQGREILVGPGVYRLTRDVSISTPVRFEGRVTMPRDKRLSLVRNFDLPSYADAFGDEQEGLRRAIQALFDFSDHDTLDMCGRRVELTEPLDVQAAVFDRTSSANQRKIRNGQIHVVPGPAWTTEIQSRACDVDPDDPSRLRNVANAGSVRVGSLVTAGRGVGREIYVKGVNVAGGVVQLSNPLWGAPERQTYTFQRFKYALDFSGFDNLQRFTLQDIEFLLADNASGVLLPRVGLIFHVKDCYFTGPRDRGITSHADGCQGLLIDRCQFLSAEQRTDVAQRHTIGFNVNKNDAKIRNNRAVKFLHWGVLGGSGHIVTGNHFFQGDATQQRTAGIVFANAQAKSVMSGNYVDNCRIEWTNEYDGDPDFESELSFGALMIVGNIVFSTGVGAGYTPIRIKPFGDGHFVNGMTVTGNTFKTIRGSHDRAEGIDTSHGTMDLGRFADVGVWGNTFHQVRHQMQNPVTVPLAQGSAQTQWTADLSEFLPFGAQARAVTAVQAEGAIRDGSNRPVWSSPHAFAGVGAGKRSVRVTWETAAKGKVFVTARCDAPT